MVSDPNPFETGLKGPNETLRGDTGVRTCDDCRGRTEHVYDHSAGLFLCAECEL